MSGGIFSFKLSSLKKINNIYSKHILLVILNKLKACYYLNSKLINLHHADRLSLTRQ